MSQKVIPYKVNIFEKAYVESENGTISSYSRGWFKGLFRWIPFMKNWGKEISEQNIEDIGAIVPLSMKKFKIFNVSCFLLADSNSDTILRVKKEDYKNLINHLNDNNIRALHEKNKRVIDHKNVLDNIKSSNPQPQKDHSIWVYEDIIYGIKPSGVVNRLAPWEARFYNVTKSNSDKVNLYFGYLGQIDYPNATKEESDYIHNHLLNKKSPIGRSADYVYKMKMTWWRINFWIKPWYWNLKEEIRIYNKSYVSSDDNLEDGEAVGYQMSQGRKRDNIYLPLKEIAYASIKNRKVKILGEQNITPIFRVPFESSKQLKLHLKEIIRRSKSGTKIGPALLCIPQYMKCKTKIYDVGSHIIFSFGKKDNHIFNSSGITTWYACKRHFYNLFGRIIVEGYADNIRKDQEGYGKQIIVKGVWRPKKKGKSAFGESKMVKDKDLKDLYKGMLYGNDKQKMLSEKPEQLSIPESISQQDFNNININNF